MYKLYFKPSKGRDRLIGSAWSQKACVKLIYFFLEEHNFKFYYMRTWETEYKGKKATEYDVGSHTEFFFVVKQ